VLPTIPNEEKKHYLPKGEDTESKSPFTGILIASFLIVAIVTILVIAILKPWAGTDTTNSTITSSNTSVVAPTDFSENGSGTDSSMLPEPTPFASEEPTPIEEIATPEPTIDPSVIIAAVNVKIRNIGLIYFEPDTTTVRADSFSKLDQLASVFSEYKGIIRVSLTGHTAQIGTQGEQTELSAQRAKLIADEMIERGAIDKDAIVWQGVGATMPATTDARRIELNRRVEIVVTMR
jgi:outer membrane protein OmpA-like peptidoglycan-associated protein